MIFRFRYRTGLRVISKYCRYEYYWIKGIARGYLNLSPFAVLILAMTMQTIFRMPKKMTIGIPTIKKHKGIARNM